jgi:hypothetical protein
LQGFNLWLARGWNVWGSIPDRGSLIDETSAPDLKAAFTAFLASGRTISLDQWNKSAKARNQQTEKPKSDN